MKVVNVILSVLVLVLAIVSAVFSFFLFEKRTQLLKGWETLAAAVNSAAEAVDADSGTSFAGTLSRENLSHLKYGELNAKLAEYRSMNEKLLKERDDMADALYRIGSLAGTRNMPGKADFRKFASYSGAIDSAATGVNDMIKRHENGMAAVSRSLRYVGVSINAGGVLNNEAAAVSKLEDELKRTGALKDEYEKAIRIMAGEAGIRDLNFGPRYQEDAKRAVAGVQVLGRNKGKLAADLGSANEKIASLENALALRNKEIEDLKKTVDVKEQQLGEIKSIMKIDSKDDMPNPWKKGSTEARMAIYGKVIEVNKEYGYVGLSVGKATRVYQQLGPSRTVEIDPVVVPGMELKIYRGLLENGNVEFVSTVKIDKVNDDCSIANLPMNVDIQVGDSICFEPTDANAALAK